jgi:hypothetical protein
MLKMSLFQIYQRNDIFFEILYKFRLAAQLWLIDKVLQIATISTFK